MEDTFEHLVDPFLSEYIKNTEEKMYNILDLACGTGDYLIKQSGNFSKERMNWHGVDSSPYLLEQANGRASQIIYRHGYAEDLPYDREWFHYVAMYDAFQYFIQKEQALDEVHRVLKDNGRLTIGNTSPEDMKQWWIYHYFPEAYAIDFERYWTKHRLIQELEDRNFQVQMTINHHVEVLSLPEVVERLEARNYPILSILNDRDYEKGRARVEADLQHEPNKTIKSEYTEMVCVADLGVET